MATITGTNLLDQILADRGITGLSALQKSLLAARFDQMIEAGQFTNTQIALVLGNNPTIAATVPEGESLLTNLSQSVADAKDVIEALPTEPTEPTEPVEPVVDHYELRAAKAEANEGEANTFTVVAVDVDGNEVAVKEAVSVVFELKIAAGDTASLADFNAGAFNPVTVTIAAGQAVSAPFSVEPITNDGTETTETYTVTATVAGETLTVNAKILDGSAGAGQTFVLTKDLDVIPGMNGSNGNAVNSGNDTIIGAIDASGATPSATTFQALDMIDGGKGTDTLKLNDASGAAISLANVSNVEIVEVSGSAAVSIDSTTTAGVTNLNVLKAGTAVSAKAAATTDINVSLKQGTAVGNAAPTADVKADIAVTGGKNVTVNVTDVKQVLDPDAGSAELNGIVVGGAGAAAAAGTVTVTSTGAATAANADATLSSITVTGGTTISVTQKATSDASAAAADTTGTTITQGAVTVNGNASTTTVTVKQDASVAEVAAVVAVAAKAATQEVTFTEAKKGDTIKIVFDGDNGAKSLLFTAKKDLTAAEVASAFANLAKDANQGNASATLGIYTDAGDTNGWSSGAVIAVDATKSKVVFSNSTNLTPTDGSNTSIKAAVTGTVTVPTVGAAVNGTGATPAKTGVLGVANGKVDIEDSGAGVIKTITIDGYGASSDIGSDTAATAALETLNLSNSGFGYTGTKVSSTADITVADTAATLALNLEKVGAAPALENATGNGVAAITLTAAPTTLNIKSTGANYVKMDADETETLNVSGTGLLTLTESANDKLKLVKTITVTETAGLTLGALNTNAITSVNTTGTTGTTTVAIKGDLATYAGGAGVDNVTVTNTGALAKAIDLGAGNDRLDLSGADLTQTISVEFKGGDGDADTLVLTAAQADTATNGATTFQSKISGFERLEVQAVAASTDKTVVLENLDAINYVITKGGVAAVANVFGGASATVATDGGGAAEYSTVTLDLAGNALLRGQSVTVNGVTVTATAASMTEEQVVNAFTGTVAAGLLVTGSFATPATWTGTPVAAKTGAATFTLTNTVVGNVTDYTTAPVSGATGFSSLLKLDKMLNNATVQLDGGNNLEVVLKDATGLTDVVNLITNSDVTSGTTKDLGVVTAAGVESINITANDTDLTKIGDVENVSTHKLTLSANKASTIKVDGKGNLELVLASTATEVTLIDGSTAEGKLTVATLAGDTAATTVKGGSAADTLTAAGANDVLEGGAGNDTLKVTTGTAVTLSGGDGIDAFDVSGYKGTVGGAATITDFAKGETIKFVSNAAADFNSGKVTLIAESTFTEYVNEAMKVASADGTLTHGVAWFQFNNNTFVVQNMAADNTFNDGTDIIVKITGAVDLSASSFNEVGQGTLLFI